MADLYLFADDAKLFKHVNNDIDQHQLQEAIYLLQQWSDKWLLKLNIHKCKIISIGSRVQRMSVKKPRDKKPQDKNPRDNRPHDKKPPR